MSGLKRKHLLEMTIQAIPSDLAERWARPWTRRRVLRGLDLLALWRLRGVAERLAAVRAPALVVWGTRDDVFPPSHAEPLLEALPGAELKLAPGAGHWSMLDAPEVVGGYLATFLRDGRRKEVGCLLQGPPGA